MAEEDRRQSSEIIALAQRFKQEGNVQGVVNKGKRSQPRAPRRSNKKNLFFFVFTFISPSSPNRYS